jgi:ATP-dependent DNA helicase RecG
MEIGRAHIQPAIIPYWETIKMEEDKLVGIISLPADSPDKPYKARRGAVWTTVVRFGSTSRDATREQEARLYQASHLMRYDIRPVAGTSMESLDLDRIENYFCDILGQDCPDLSNKEGWIKILLNTDILVENRDRKVASVGGFLLFGNTPNRYLPQAGITATAYPGDAKDYATLDEEIIRGPLVSLISRKGKVVEKGVIDRAVDFVMRNMKTVAWLEGGRRRVKKAYPLDAIRESIINAVAHRDYTITVTDIEISLYSDRLEIISPGRLPNTVTIEKMKQGYRAARNELLKEILRDYGYVEHRGMGVRNRIILSMMEHNGTEPDLIENGDRFIVKLWKGKK